MIVVPVPEWDFDEDLSGLFAEQGGPAIATDAKYDAPAPRRRVRRNV